MAINLTTAQKLAIETTDRSIVLSAGAGSGKTRVLVLRYIHLLKERLATVEQILAITFTNKAAGEMKERIQKEVSKETLQAKTVEEKEFWRGVKEDLQHAQVSTFHSFCGQLLRQHPLEAGVDPYFRVLEEIEAGQLLRECIEELLLSALDEGRPEWVTLVREFGLWAIDRLLFRAYLGSRGEHFTGLVQKTSQNTLEKSPALDAVKAEMQELVDELLHSLHTDNLAAGTRSKLVELEDFWREHASAVLSLTSLRDRNRRLLLRMADLLKGNVAAAVKERMKRLQTICTEEVTRSLADQRMLDLLEPLVGVLQEIHQKYSLKKQAMNSMDFEDLQELAIRMLTTHPELTGIYRERYRFIMVDEFQDTNPVQETMLHLLIGGAGDAPVTGTRLFIVGDPKQSIYRFRGADVTIMKELKKEIVGQGGQEILMHKNFRSREKVIAFVNHFFQRVFGTNESRYDLSYESSEYARACNPAERCVEFMFLSNEELKNEDMDKREEEATQLALRIQQMVNNGEKLVYAEDRGEEQARPVEYGDICILFQALTNIQLYEEALQRFRIPYTVVNGRGYYERAEIRDLINLLKLVDNVHREIEWVGVLRSPFVGLSDEDLYFLSQVVDQFSTLLHLQELTGLSAEAVARLRQFITIFREARENRERKPLSRLISELLNRTGYWELTLAHPYAALVRANIHKFIALARSYEQNAGASVGGFIKYLQGLADAEAREGMAQIPGEGNQVKLMSVHQSKGLEFPVVVLADVQRNLINASVFPAIVFDPELGLGMRLRDPLFSGTLQTSLHAAIWEAEKIRDMAERKRTLYVAATRARDYLLVSGTARKFKTTEIDAAASWFEWFGLIFGFQTPDQLAEELTYGTAGEHIIRIRQRQVEEALAETAVSVEGREPGELTRADWFSEAYRTGLAPVEPRGKSGFYEFGVTQLLTYNKCPRQYYYRFIEHVPVSIVSPLQALKLPELLDTLTMSGSPGDVLSDGAADNPLNSLSLDAAERGTLIHFLCERYREPDSLAELIRQGLRRQGRKYGITPARTGELVTVVQPYLDMFLKEESRLQEALQGEAITERREAAFNLISGQALIRGSIDRLITTPDGVMVIDYKSNRLTTAQAEEMAEQYRLQMEIYALAAYLLTGQDRVKGRLHFLLPNNVIDWEFTPAELAAVQSRLEQITGRIIESAQRGVQALAGLEAFFPCGAPQAEVCPEQAICVYSGLCKDSWQREELGEVKANRIK